MKTVLAKAITHREFLKICGLAIVGAGAGQVVVPPKPAFAYTYTTLTVGDKIGVGTESPQTSVHIRSVAPRLAFSDTDSATSTSWIMRSSDVGDAFRIQRTTDFSTIDDVITILPSGRVGIGTTNPLEKLDIRGGWMRLNGGLNITDANGAVYQDNWIGMALVDGDAKWLHIGGITSTKTGDSSAYRRIGLFADRVFVSGKLGIGHVSPEEALHLYGGAIKISDRKIADGGGCYYA